MVGLFKILSADKQEVMHSHTHHHPHINSSARLLFRLNPSSPDPPESRRAWSSLVQGLSSVCVHSMFIHTSTLTQDPSVLRSASHTVASSPVHGMYLELAYYCIKKC